jgi:hypothetical protein
MGIVRICAWCGKVLGVHPNDEHFITSTICPACIDNLEFQHGVDLQRFLDSLPEPVLVVTGSVQVHQANTAPVPCWANRRRK